MSTNGQLVFTDVDKITFKGVGNASNAVVDTLTGKIGVGTDSPEANLHVLGNSYVSTNLELGGTLIMGTVNVEAQHSLEAVTATGNITPLTVEFTNATTSLVASGNVVVTGNVTADHFVGDGSNITGISSTLQAITDSGPGANVTSNTVQFSNAITGFVTTANVEVGTANLFVDTSSSRVGIGTNVPSAPLHVYNNSLGSTTGNSTDILKFGGDSNGAGALLLTAERLSTGSNWASTGLRLQKIVDVTKMAYVQFGSDTGNTSGELLFGTGDATERMRITADGNVAIGTTAPTELLDIAAAPGDYDAFIRLRSGSGATSPVTESGLKLTESGEYGFQFAHSGATDLLKIRHQNSAGTVDKDDIMVWHPNGIVTTASKPAFYAWDNVSSRRNHNLGILMHDSTTYNIGSHYNTSTGRFVTPVAGTYIFAAVIVHDTANALSSPIYSFYVDGANRRDIIEGTGSHNAHYEQHGVYIVNLAANKSVDIRSRSASDVTFVNGNHGAYYRNCFQGALLG